VTAPPPENRLVVVFEELPNDSGREVAGVIERPLFLDYEGKIHFIA
jgi:hypothetical protein